MRTIRARVSFWPERSPTMATRSPTTAALRPSSRAFIASTIRSVDQTGQAAPVDGEDHALDRLLVLGADVRTRSVALSVRAGADVVLVGVLAVAAHGVSPLCPIAPEHPGPQVGEVRQRLRRRRHVLDLHALHREADDRAGRRHAVVLVGVEDPAVQPARADVQAVGALRDVTAEFVDLLGERGQPVRLVQAQMRHARAGWRGSPRGPRPPRCPGSARRPRPGRHRCRGSRPNR